MPKTTTRPISFYTSCAPDYLWEEDEIERADREERRRREDDHIDDLLQRRREKR